MNAEDMQAAQTLAEVVAAYLLNARTGTSSRRLSSG